MIFFELLRVQKIINISNCPQESTIPKIRSHPPDSDEIMMHCYLNAEKPFDLCSNILYN